MIRTFFLLLLIKIIKLVLKATKGLVKLFLTKPAQFPPADYINKNLPEGEKPKKLKRDPKMMVLGAIFFSIVFYNAYKYKIGVFPVTLKIVQQDIVFAKAKISDTKEKITKFFNPDYERQNAKSGSKKDWQITVKE